MLREHGKDLWAGYEKRINDVVGGQLEGAEIFIDAAQTVRKALEKGVEWTGFLTEHAGTLMKAAEQLPETLGNIGAKAFNGVLTSFNRVLNVAMQSGAGIVRDVAGDFAGDLVVDMTERASQAAACVSTYVKVKSGQFWALANGETAMCVNGVFRVLNEIGKILPVRQCPSWLACPQRFA